MKKKIVLGICIISLLFVFNGCIQKADQSHVTSDSPEILPTVSILLGTAPGIEYRENLRMWQYAETGSGIDIEVKAIPEAELISKMYLMGADPQSLPDMIYVGSKYSAERLADADMLIKLSDNLDKMPEYKNYLGSLRNGNEIENMHKLSNGGLYIAPAFGVDKINTQAVWMYRSDIFEQNKIKVPTTYNELFVSARALKTKFPNSFPLALNHGMESIDLIAPAWKNDFSIDAYYDSQKQKWFFGAREETMKEIIYFLKNAYAVGLLPPNYLTMKDLDWEKLIGNGQCFIMPDKIWRVNQLNKKYPNQNWSVMPAPRANTKSGQNKIANRDMTVAGYVLCNTKDDARKRASFQLLNWMYSHEAEDLLSWGVEGQTFQTRNGERRFITKGSETARDRYGVGTIGLCQRLDPFIKEQMIPNKNLKLAKITENYLEKHVNPAHWVPLNEEEQRKMMRLRQKIDPYIYSEFSAFLTGKKPIPEWNVFQKKLEKLDIQQVLEIYKKAHERIS